MHAAFDITSAEQLRALVGHPHPLNVVKAVSVLDDHCRAFLALSTFCTIATCSAAGRMDVSPKGDPAGFAVALDERTIAIPERPGNRRCDTFTNVLENPAIGLIFLVPGVDETLRVNGMATLSADPALLSRLVAFGHLPKLALVVHVEEAFVHCGKALKRGSVWDPAAQSPERGGLASMGEILHAHTAARANELGITQDRLCEMAEHDYHNNVY